jgi:hypothetical protein
MENGPELQCPRLLRNLRIRPCGVCCTGSRYDFLTKNKRTSKRSFLPVEAPNPPGPGLSLANLPSAGFSQRRSKHLDLIFARRKQMSATLGRVAKVIRAYDLDPHLRNRVRDVLRNRWIVGQRELTQRRG